MHLDPSFLARTAFHMMRRFRIPESLYPEGEARFVSDALNGRAGFPLFGPWLDRHRAGVPSFSFWLGAEADKEAA